MTKEITLESIAKHCIDDNITGLMIEYLLATQAELKRLQGIEKALQWMTYEFAKIRDNPPSIEAAIFWRLKSELCKGPEGIMYGLIADALEVK